PLSWGAVPVLTGRVADSRGKPITGAIVRVQTDDGRAPTELATDNRGAFRAEIKGAFHLEIRHDGYRTVRTSAVSLSAASDNTYQIEEVRLISGSPDQIDTVILQLEEFTNPESRDAPAVREGL